LLTIFLSQALDPGGNWRGNRERAYHRLARKRARRGSAYSAVTIGEIQAGIEITGEQDRDKAVESEAWLGRVAETYNILGMDARRFRSWGRLMHRRSDHPMEDAMIVVTASVHGLIVATGNIRDFEALGVFTLNSVDRSPGWRALV
jgi:predicted nucleic acid-binding protein